MTTPDNGDESPREELARDVGEAADTEVRLAREEQATADEAMLYGDDTSVIAAERLADLSVRLGELSKRRKLYLAALVNRQNSGRGFR